MPCIYILFSGVTNKFYIGSSRENTAESRLSAHNKGKTRSTKSGKPWNLIYEEQHDDYNQARKRENFLKSGVGRKWIYEKFSKYKS